MSYYTLNLGFNVNDSFAVKQGGFEGPPASPSVPPLLQSQMWLKSEVPPGTGTTYTVLDGKGIQVAGGDEILVRLFSAGAPAASMMAQSIIVFGRRHIDQTFRTPFTLGNRNARTILNSGDRISPNFDGAWLFELGVIAIAPPEPDLLYQFRFIAGASVKNNGNEYTFGHDPEMDVGMGVGGGPAPQP